MALEGFLISRIFEMMKKTYFLKWWKKTYFFLKNKFLPEEIENISSPIYFISSSIEIFSTKLWIEKFKWRQLLRHLQQQEYRFVEVSGSNFFSIILYGFLRLFLMLLRNTNRIKLKPNSFSNYTCMAVFSWFLSNFFEDKGETM